MKLCKIARPGEWRRMIVGLAPVENGHLIRREALEVQQVRRVRLGHGEVGKLDVVEAG